ncbi:MAG TPA: PD-(D/E)XK nuclease family protein, partial [Nitrospira sp.]
LRDTQRQLLSSTLGFAIEEKLAGHDEERLLFELLCRSATHRLYLSYQRSDEDGRVLVPSALIQTALSDPRFAAAPEVAVPRRLTARVAAQPAIQELLPAQDVALSFVLHKQDAGAILEQTGQNRRLFESGLNALEIMERDASVLGPFDGILHAPAVTHALFDAQSISPTSLERYASCPFRYFAEKWLRLEPVRPAREDQLPPLTFGRLLHDILRVSYERLAALRWPDLPIDRSTIGQTIAGAAQDVFTGHAATQGTGHALLWALAQDQIVDLVTALAAEDEQEYRSSGFRPHSFEIEAEGVVALGATELKVHGKLDRVDFRQNPPGLRIVDYKFKLGREMGQADGNLLRSALRGWKLQPPLYGSMSIPTLPPPAQVQFLYLAPRWKEPIVRRIFEMSAFAGRTGDAIKHTIATLVQGIERREFFILPDGYCDHCEFTVTCRRHDQTAWWRSYRSPEARALRQLRKQKVTDD